ncbi:MAG: alpha/beta hydrolase [Lachnospiraceae bacterium]|nr:alpha/beta hydrolase [Lachnospiraceae bacterium]
MIKVWEITIPPLTGNEKRRAYVYLPASYKNNPNKRYPVLYMFDGHNVFFDDHATYGKSWGMKDFMDRTKTEMIIAAVECNHDPDNGRLKEYSPYDFSDERFGTIEGKGYETLEWLINTFKKQIDKKFRTLPDREHTFIAGSSMGGLMSYFAVLHRNDVFSRAACLSPSLWAGTVKLYTLTETCLLEPNTVVYMDYGSRELKNHEDMIQCFSRYTSLLMERGVYVQSRIVPEGEHCEACWEKQIPIFMEALTYGLKKVQKNQSKSKKPFWKDWTKR